MIPKVSVVIPNYNQTRYIRAAIQSALNQTYRSFEVIVVDDGSTDSCRGAVAEFGDRVQYLWQENQGLGGARNTGIRAAKGELIGLLDADDQWQPAFLETLVSLAVQYPKAAVYYCCAQSMNAEGRDLPQVFGGPLRASNGMYNSLLRANFLIPSTIVMRRPVIMKAGLFEQTLRSIHGCEDWDLWLRIAPEHDFVGTSACLVRYRLHANTFSANLSAMQNALSAVVEKHFGADDGNWQSWSWEKRRAYGGVYRHQLLTSVQRKDDWESALGFFRRALQVDPTLAEDIDLFYDLALGNQPPGFRGTPYQLDLKSNASQISTLLCGAFDSASAPDWEAVGRQVYGTASFALGLVAYNTGQRSRSRHFFIRALRFRPGLWRDPRLFGDLIRTLINPALLDKAKRIKSHLPLHLGSSRLQ